MRASERGKVYQSLVNCMPKNGRMLSMRAIGGFLAILVTASSLSFASPRDVENYNVIQGGLADIHEGAYVEGSVRQGGLQPDYFIDVDSPRFMALLEKSKQIGESGLSLWEKINQVKALIGQETFRHREYKNADYLRLLEKYRDLKQDVPLSEYFACKSGVCREHALVLHFALKAAGIPNRHVYARVYQADVQRTSEVEEDHAFVVVQYQGADWTVDAYNPLFDGVRLKDLVSPKGVHFHSYRAPLTPRYNGFFRVLQIYDFPKIYNPKHNEKSCQRLFR